MNFATLPPLLEQLTKCCPCHDFCPGGRVLILINIAKKILISIVFQYRVLIFHPQKSIEKSIKKKHVNLRSKSIPGTAAKVNFFPTYGLQKCSHLVNTYTSIYKKIEMILYRKRSFCQRPSTMALLSKTNES